MTATDPAPGSADETARRLFERFYRPLRGFFERRGASAEASFDLTQETFLRVYRGMRTFRGDASRRTWIYAIARNVWRDARARAVRRHALAPVEPWPVTVGEDGTEKPADLPADDPGPEERARRRELDAAVHAALGRLAPGMRRCLELHLQGFKHGEIAEILGLALGTVKSHLHSAKKRLAEELLSCLGEGDEP